MAGARTPEIVVRRYRENGCDVMAVIEDPADAQRTVYVTVTRAGVLRGSYHPADPIRQDRWCVVRPDGDPVPVESETAALLALITGP